MLDSNSFRGFEGVRTRYIGRDDTAARHALDGAGPRSGCVPQVGQPCVIGSASATRSPVVPGQHRLAAVRELAQSRGPVDRRTDVVVLVAQLHLAGVQHPIRRRNGASGARCSASAQATALDARLNAMTKLSAFALLDRTDPVVGGHQIGQYPVQTRDRRGQSPQGEKSTAAWNLRRRPIAMSQSGRHGLVHAQNRSSPAAAYCSMDRIRSC